MAALLVAVAAVGLVARWVWRAFRRLRNELGAARHQLTALTETLSQLALLDETVATVGRARAAGGLGEETATRLLDHLARLRGEIAAAGQPY